MRAPERRATSAEALASNHMVSSGRLVPAPEGTRQRTRQFLRDSGGTRQEEDASGGAPQMIKNGADFCSVPTSQLPVTPWLAFKTAVEFSEESRFYGGYTPFSDSY